MKIGFLPLYIKLYDERTPAYRERLDPFYEKLATMFEDRGVEVVRNPFCRVEEEFKAAVSKFENEKVDAIVTWHAAYSPSLESIEVLANTELPIVVLDTTETYEFTGEQDPSEVGYCHGIHGVMDMCSMLTRYGKSYAIAAGHYEKSDCIDEACRYVKAAVAARAVKGSKTAIFGEPFKGMGDFSVPASDYSDIFGVELVNPDSAEVKKYIDAITEEELEAALKEQKEKYDFSDESIVEDEYKVSLKTGIALKKYLKDKEISAFTVCFLSVGGENALPVMPFVACCEAMQEGIGYAGEGDTLTATFVGALLKSYKETNFIEIFCPDWKNGAFYLSHMGETNYAVADIKPEMKRKAVTYTDGVNPYSAYTRMKGGKGVFLNVCKDQTGYKLVIAESEMMSVKKDNFINSMRGWLKTEKSTAEFLKAISVNGATHHSIFVYGATVEEMVFFAETVGLKPVII